MLPGCVGHTVGSMELLSGQQGAQGSGLSPSHGPWTSGLSFEGLSSLLHDKQGPERIPAALQRVSRESELNSQRQRRLSPGVHLLEADLTKAVL